MAGSSLSLKSNSLSITIQRHLSQATQAVSKASERLASGLRINSPSDDAAGLALSSSLKTDSRVLSQGIKNINDGVSVLNIADSALSNLTNITVRLQELAEQSANGTLGESQREAIDTEAQALSKEYFRIARTTKFNGLNLFDGSLQGLRLQGGYGEAGSVFSSLGGELGTGKFSSTATIYATETLWSRKISLADLDGDGFVDLVTTGQSSTFGGETTVRMGLGDGRFSSDSKTYNNDGSGGYEGVSLSDLNGDGVLDLITAGYDGANVRLGIGDGSFGAATNYATEPLGSRALELSDLNGDGNLDMITAGDGPITVRLGAGNGEFSEATTTYSVSGVKYSLKLRDINNDGITDMVFGGETTEVRLGLGDGTFALTGPEYSSEHAVYSLGLSDLNGDGISDLVTAGQGDKGQATVRLGTGDGSFSSVATAYEMDQDTTYDISLIDANGDGFLDLISSGIEEGVGNVTVRLGLGDGSFTSTSTKYKNSASQSSGLALSDLNGDGVLDMVDVGDQSANVRLGITQDGVSPLLPFNLSTMAGARQAIPLFQQKLAQLSNQRGEIGAFQSRLSSASSVLTSSMAQFSAANSRIEDADIAEEMATLLGKRILQNASASVLAQANQQPSLVLELLGTETKKK